MKHDGKQVRIGKGWKKEKRGEISLRSLQTVFNRTTNKEDHMENGKHTKGPWVVKAKHKMSGCHDILYEDKYILATIKHGINIIREGEANARLIAAGPEILEACREALTYLDKSKSGGISLREQLNQAITKATSL